MPGLARSSMQPVGSLRTSLCSIGATAGEGAHCTGAPPGSERGGRPSGHQSIGPTAAGVQRRQAAVTARRQSRQPRRGGGRAVGTFGRMTLGGCGPRGGRGPSASGSSAGRGNGQADRPAQRGGTSRDVWKGETTRGGEMPRSDDVHAADERAGGGHEMVLATTGRSGVLGELTSRRGGGAWVRGRGRSKSSRVKTRVRLSAICPIEQIGQNLPPKPRTPLL